MLVLGGWAAKTDESDRHPRNNQVKTALDPSLIERRPD